MVYVNKKPPCGFEKMLSRHFEKTYTPKVLFIIPQAYLPSKDLVW